MSYEYITSIKNACSDVMPIGVIRGELFVNSSFDNICPFGNDKFIIVFENIGICSDEFRCCHISHCYTSWSCFFGHFN